MGIAIKKPLVKGPVKLYARVPSSSTVGVTHTVTFIRKPGMERWACTCLDQLFDKLPKRRHCTHIKQVRQQIESQRQVA
jgi:hypothetical protein